ncbi:MAG: hypothetical protein AB9866_04755 [Syntrophobacteraceae bacterium]
MQSSEGPTNSSSVISLREGICDGFKSLVSSTANKLKSHLRRLFMTETVQQYGPGGQIWAERELGWNRSTIRKGMHELRTGIECKDAFCLRGRKAYEKRLPSLLDDIRDIVDPKAQIDATFRTSDLFVRVTANEVRQLLIEEKGYKDAELPKRRTINTILNSLGYRLRKVKKTGR